MVNANSPSRQARLKAWLLLHNIEQKELASQLDISQQLLSMTLSGKRATEKRIEQLKDLGIPSDLLPELQEKKKTGPKTYHLAGGYMKSLLTIFILCIALVAMQSIADAAGRYSMPRLSSPKQGYTRQLGGNAKQNSTVEYDRGNKRYSQTVKPGQTFYTPKGATNVTRGGRPISPSSRGTVSPQGAIILGD